VVLLLALYWPGLTTWFYQDDFGWLNLRHDVHSVADLPRALLAPKAHGNMRPLGENAYWLGIASVFGAEALPFHLATFVTQAASLLLLGAIVRRLTDSAWAVFAAQVLWLVNIGVAGAMGWSSIYNQVLSAFFFLLAFYFLLRSQWRWHWAAFLLGLGALEINVVYPAIAVVYGLLFDRPAVKKVLPMFAVSALAVFVHFYFAPAADTGPYAPRVDGRVFASVWTYWSWGLGPMAAVLTAAVCAAVVAGVRRRRYEFLLALAWFAFPLAPYLPLPEHRMDYYLVVPAIGIAMFGAFAVVRWRVPAAIAVLLCVGASLPAALRMTQWQHARGERVEDLVLGVAEARRAEPEPIILLDGIDSDLFWSGIADLPFRALGIPRVYLAPGGTSRIQAAPELLSKYTLPAALARDAAVYRFDGERLHRVSQPAIPDEDEPRLVNLADDVFAKYFDYRAMSSTATVRMGGPRTASEQLYIGVFDTRELRLRVRVNGVELPVARASRGTDLSEYLVTLPAAALEWKRMEVVLEAANGPLQFGYLEVR
jgi:hypothetical protein